jgi:poly(3-hydroxybutyrate) depolymerase
MDQPTMKRRLYRGMNVVNPAANRDLAKQTFRVRVPGGYTPRTPAGLLVWCSPHGSAQTPRGFESALDELNILCICVDSGGNDRPTPDRLQLMFDAVTNATRRFHIDPRRVYISGLSGGGKISTIAMFCYPEIFRGAIPIVGLATHSTLGESWGEHSSGYFAKPAGDLAAQARARRVAPVTGEHDMNYAEIKERVRLLEADGFDQVRLFDVPGMGHTMPPADVCAEALRFIDEPGRAAMKAEGDAAQQKLDAYLGERKDATPRSEDDRRALAAVMQAGPWSEAAWKALDLLRSAATTRPANGPT